MGLDIASAAQLDIHAAVFDERLDHVCQEGQLRQIDIGGTTTVEVDAHADLGLLGVALQGGLAGHSAALPPPLRRRVAASSRSWLEALCPSRPPASVVDRP